MIVVLQVPKGLRLHPGVACCDNPLFLPLNHQVPP